MKSMQELANKIAANEGKKKEVKIGDIKEILRITALIAFQDPECLQAFLAYGSRVSKQEHKKNSRR